MYYSIPLMSQYRTFIAKFSLLCKERIMEKTTVLANNIRFLRKREGLNQEQLGQELKIKRSNIASYEAKNVEPRLRIILELAKYFDIDIQTLLETRLDETIDYPKFSSGIKPPQHLKLEADKVAKTEDITAFLDKNEKVKKILIGFKTLYNFRKAKISDTTPSKDKILSDIDNFIMLIEHLLAHNESLVKSLSSQNESLEL